MKLIHAANILAGCGPEGTEGRFSEYGAAREEGLKKLVMRCEEEQADLLLVSGNLFDGLPSHADLEALDRLFGGLTKTRVFIVPGIRDGARQGGTYAGYTWESRTMLFPGDSLQRVYVPEANAEITCCGYNEKTWAKVRPERITPGKKGRFQILLLPFLGRDDSEEALREYLEAHGQAIGFDYAAIGQQLTRSGEDGIPVYSVRGLVPDSFDEDPKTGVFECEFNNDKRSGNRVVAKLTPVAESAWTVLRVRLDPSRTIDAVEQEIRSAIDTQGKDKVYRLVLSGRPSVSVWYLKDSLKECGNIAEFSDETEDVTDTVLKNEAVRRFAEEIGRLPDGKAKTAALRCGILALLKQEGQAQ